MSSTGRDGLHRDSSVRYSRDLVRNLRPSETIEEWSQFLAEIFDFAEAQNRFKHAEGRPRSTTKRADPCQAIPPTTRFCIRSPLQKSDAASRVVRSFGGKERIPQNVRAAADAASSVRTLSSNARQAPGQDSHRRPQAAAGGCLVLVLRPPERSGRHLDRSAGSGAPAAKKLRQTLDVGSPRSWFAKPGNPQPVRQTAARIKFQGKTATRLNQSVAVLSRSDRRLARRSSRLAVIFRAKVGPGGRLSRLS